MQLFVKMAQFFIARVQGSYSGGMSFLLLAFLIIFCGIVDGADSIAKNPVGFRKENLLDTTILSFNHQLNVQHPTQMPLYEFGDLIEADKKKAVLEQKNLKILDSVKSTLSTDSPKGIIEEKLITHLPSVGPRVSIISMLNALLGVTGKLAFLVLLIIGASASVWFFIYLIRRSTGKPRFMTTTRLSIMDKEVQRACRYIEKHYSNPKLTVESVCEAIITGRAFLEALFERELGMSVSDFIDHVRINRIKVEFMKEPDTNIEELFSSNGYSDSSAFFSAFRKVSGIPFNEFRLSVLKTKGLLP